DRECRVRGLRRDRARLGDPRSRAGSLQHGGLMKRGAGSLTVSIVPDSGAEGFAGIAGTMTIEIIVGSHLYALDYCLDETHRDLDPSAIPGPPPAARRRASHDRSVNSALISGKGT